jgi:hypothetical protein
MRAIVAWRKNRTRIGIFNGSSCESVSSITTFGEIGYVILDVYTELSREAFELLREVNGTLKARYGLLTASEMFVG